MHKLSIFPLTRHFAKPRSVVRKLTSPKMKKLKFTAFLLYRYYSCGKRPDATPHFRTLLSLIFIGFIHLFQLLIILDKEILIPISKADGKMYTRW